MKKLILSFLIIISSSSILLGCNNLTKDKNNNLTPKENTSSNEKSKNTKANTKNDLKNTTDKYNSDNNISSSRKENLDNNSIALLNNIKSSANKGQIINSSFKIGESIDSVTSKLGSPTSETYVPNAKGDYFTFKSYNIALGCNKGNQIFEIRSFDKQLKELNSTIVKNFFGTSDYNATTKENEKILGYKTNKNYKILFVFDLNTNKLKHYSVLNTELTKNSMSGDLGRSW